MIRKFIYILLIGGIALCASPILAVLWATNFANRHGCELHEGFVNTCVVNGADWGGTLYQAVVSGWLLMLTIPIGVILLVVLILFAFGNLIIGLLKR
jgi:hypothetical protein